MSTATLPHVFSLPPDERRAEYDAALDRAMDAAHEAAVDHKARKADPRSALDYRAWRTMRLVCVLVVKHADKPSSIEASLDGISRPRIYIPNSKLIAMPESTDEFALMLLPKWLCEKSGLMGVTPDLVGEWTDDQRKLWDSLRRTRLSINTKIHYANRRASSNISRSNAA
jgi:hypothetical protein